MASQEVITLTALSGGASAWRDVSGLRYPLTVTVSPGLLGTASIETSTVTTTPAAGDIEASADVTDITAMASFTLYSRTNWMRVTATGADATLRILQSARVRV